ncbi:MAG: sulfite exporter TauE/SafE family protein [Rhodospirillales bacterium]
MIAGQPWPTVVFLIAVAFVAGLARGFSGFGSALIFIPLGSAAVGPALASAVLLVVDGLGSTPMLPAAWREADRRAVFTMSTGAIVAVPVGTLALAWIDPSTLRWGICLAILLLVMVLASGWRYSGRPVTAVTVGVGLVSGFLTGTAQIGGAPAIAYWLGGALQARNVRANLVLFLACSTFYSAISYAASGLFNWRMAALSLAIGPAYVVGALLGMRMFGLASPQTFRRICYALIALAAILGLPIFR